jgi:hypothetical protein
MRSRSNRPGQPPRASGKPAKGAGGANLAGPDRTVKGGQLHQVELEEAFTGLVYRRFLEGIGSSSSALKAMPSMAAIAAAGLVGRGNPIGEPCPIIIHGPVDNANRRMDRSVGDAGTDVKG